jgi:hypothetical protein
MNGDGMDDIAFIGPEAGNDEEFLRWLSPEVWSPHPGLQEGRSRLKEELNFAGRKAALERLLRQPTPEQQAELDRIEDAWRMEGLPPPWE